MAHQEPCQHLKAWTHVVAEKKHVCEECVKIHGSWVHLRTCQTCGVTLCCDSSPHRHASQHAHAMQHPVAISSEPGERWAWCYMDERIMGY